MKIKMGTRELEWGTQLRELRDSNSLLGDTQALNQRMQEDGYLMFRELIPRQKVQQSREKTLQYMAECEALVPGRPVLEGAMPQGGKTVPLMGHRDITHDPALLQTLEAEELHHFFDMYFGEPAMTFDYKWLRGVGNEQFTGAHYDVVYMGRGSERLHTTWIPLGDLPIEHGTLAICAGSHRLKSFQKLRDTYGNMDVDRDLIQGWFSDDPLDITSRFGGEWQTTEFHMGDVLVFGMYTLHGSTTNITNRFRLSCDVRFQPAADPVDQRWIGKNPTGHTRWSASNANIKPMEIARSEWGV